MGGFAESAILQESLRSEFGYKMNVIIPQVRTRIWAEFVSIKISRNFDRNQFFKIDLIVNLLGMLEKQISHDVHNINSILLHSGLNPA